MISLFLSFWAFKWVFELFIFYAAFGWKYSLKIVQKMTKVLQNCSENGKSASKLFKKWQKCFKIVQKMTKVLQNCSENDKSASKLFRKWQKCFKIVQKMKKVLQNCSENPKVFSKVIKIENSRYWRQNFNKSSIISLSKKADKKQKFIKHLFIFSQITTFTCIIIKPTIIK